MMREMRALTDDCQLLHADPTHGIAAKRVTASRDSLCRHRFLSGPAEVQPRCRETPAAAKVAEHKLVNVRFPIAVQARCLID